jgi:hypothetical protein
MGLFLLGACDGTLTEIAVTGSASTTVEAGTVLESLLGDLGFAGLTEMDVTASEELKNQGVQPGDITTAVLTELVFTAVSGEPDLAFLSEVALSVEAANLPALTIASQDSFPEGRASVDFAVTGTDIAEYVLSQKMTLGTEVTAHRPEEDTVVRVNYGLMVGVTTQGAVSNLDR